MPAWLGPALAGAGSLLGGLFGGGGGRGPTQQVPQPFWSDTTRAPWDPANTLLQEALQQARSNWVRGTRAPGPPRISTGGIRGASGNLRDLAGAMRDRAMTSTFVPDAQARMTEFMSGPNSMMQSIFDQSQSYQNPLLDMLSQRGFSGGYGGYQPRMSGFLDDLLGGQSQLGMPNESPYNMPSYPSPMGPNPYPGMGGERPRPMVPPGSQWMPNKPMPVAMPPGSARL